MLKKKISLLLQLFQSNVYARGVAVFIGAAISDYVWAKYMAGVAAGSAYVAANWGAVVIVLGAFLVVSYVDDRRLIAPAALGAWIGTYFAV